MPARIFPKHPTAVAALTEPRGRVRGKYHMSDKYRPQMEARSSFSSIKRKERRLQAERLGRSQAVMVQEVRVVPGVREFLCSRLTLRKRQRELEADGFQSQVV